VRAAEIVVHRQSALAAAMCEPEVLVEPELGDIGLRDFHRLGDACAAGRRAMDAALPELLQRLESPSPLPGGAERTLSLRVDPVCAMVINPARARATATYGDRTYYFCSPNCRDGFARCPTRFLRRAGIVFGESDACEE
jgi:YHS domain-containing protein